MKDQEKRIDIDELPRAAEDVSDDEAKEVQGGEFYGTGVYKTTDSARSSSGNTVGGALANDPKASGL